MGEPYHTGSTGSIIDPDPVSAVVGVEILAPEFVETSAAHFNSGYLVWGFDFWFGVPRSSNNDLFRNSCVRQRIEKVKRN